MAKLKLLLIAALFLVLPVRAWAISTCTISGIVYDGAGNPVANGVVTFNTLYLQVVSGNPIAQTIVSTTTDASGNLSPISLAQGVYVQVTINNGAPVTAIVPFASTTTFAALISNIVTNPTITTLTITGQTSNPTCTAGSATIAYNTTTGFLVLDTGCGGYGNVLTAANTFPDCQDVSGNHLNYIASSKTLTCGNTSSGGGGGGSSPPFSDASALVKNNSDATKQIILSAASITTATTRTYTMPDRNLTVAGTTGATTTGHVAGFDASSNLVDLGFALASVSGNTTKAATVSGAVTSGHGAQWDASGNLVDSGAAIVPKAPILGGCSYSVNSTSYFSLASQPNTGCNTSTEDISQQTMPMAGTAKNLYCTAAVAPGLGKSWALTLRKNTASSTLTCTISGSATTCNDTTHTVSFVAADLADYLLAPSSAPAASHLSCSLELDPA